MDREGKPLFIYRFGTRALAEINMKDILKFISEVIIFFFHY